MRYSVYSIAFVAILVASGCAREAPLPPLKSGAKGHIVIGPYVQPGTQPDLAKSLRVVWWTDAPGPASLDVRTDEGAGGNLPAQTVRLEGLYRHSVEITSTNTLGSENVMATVTVGGKRFTAPVQRITFPGNHKDQPFRFAALGDTGAGTEAERKLVRLAMHEKPALVVIPGDVVYSSGEFKEYQTNFFPYYKDLMATVPILPALGNHDAGNPEHLGRPYTEVWMPPSTWAPPKGAKTPYTILRRRANKGEGPVPLGQWLGRNYSADAGRCHFLCLDSTADHDTMRDLIVPWATKDLAAAKANGAKWLIAFWHHPPYTHGAYRDNSLQWGDIRTLFVPMIKKAGVQIVINGHDHNYQHMRKDGIDYIITGGGGARLYPVVKDYDKNAQPPLLASDDEVHSFTAFTESADGKTMAVRQIDENGHQLDAFTIAAIR